MTVISTFGLFFQVGKRGPPPLEDDLYQVVYSILNGDNPVPKASRTAKQRTAYRKIRKHKLQLKNVVNPVMKKSEYAITFHDLIVPNQSSVKGIIDYFYEESHGDGSRKLEMKIRQYYTGL